jgi:hypothetical protein
VCSEEVIQRFGNERRNDEASADNLRHGAAGR